MGAASYNAKVEREGDTYIALCPELDIASQGGTVEETRRNLKVAVSLFLECAAAEEIDKRSNYGGKLRD